MLSTAMEEADATAAAVGRGAAHLTGALSSVKSSTEQSQPEDDEEALRAAPYYQTATASMLFKPASLVRKVPALEAAAGADFSCEEPDVTCSISDDDFVWPSHRSHPIPIRASRDSRPSFDAGPKEGVTAPTDPESPLAEKNQVNSSLESLVSSGSDELDIAAVVDKYTMERPSSLMFPCSGESAVP